MVVALFVLSACCTYGSGVYVHGQWCVSDIESVALRTRKKQFRASHVIPFLIGKGWRVQGCVGQGCFLMTPKKNPAPCAAVLEMIENQPIKGQPLQPASRETR